MNIKKLTSLDFLIVNIFCQNGKIALVKNSSDIGKGIFAKYDFFPISLISSDCIKKDIKKSYGFKDIVKKQALDFFDLRRTINNHALHGDVFHFLGCKPVQPAKAHFGKIWLWCFYDVKILFSFKEYVKTVAVENIYQHLINLMIDYYMPVEIRNFLAEEYKTIQSFMALKPVENYDVRLFDLENKVIKCGGCNESIFVFEIYNNCFVCKSCCRFTAGVLKKWQKI